MEPRERFRVDVFISIMDSTLSALQHWLNSHEGISANYSFLNNLHTSSSGDITVAAERLVSEYPEDFEEDLSVELIQIVSFVKLEQGQQALASNEP